MHRRVLAIVNPISGWRTMRPLIRRIGQILESNGVELVVENTQAPKHATSLAAKARDTFESVLSVGGDGTLSEVINGFDGETLPLYALRTGTENLISKQFDFPLGPAKVARTLLDGVPRKIDGGIINGRRFMAVTGIGFDAEVVRRLAAQRVGHISHVNYFVPFWETFWTHRFPELRIEADGEEVFAGRGLAFVGIIPRYAMGLRLLHRAKVDDGLLDLCVFACRSRAKLLRHAADAVFRVHDRRRDVIYKQIRSVKISSPGSDVPIEVDGEAAGCLPVEIKADPSSIVLLLPNNDRPTRDGEAQAATIA